ncbi:MAG: 3'-5' exonuclease [Desulfovibrionaceae bacterium]
MTVEIPEQYLQAFPPEVINALPMGRYEGPIRLVRTEKQLSQAVRDLQSESLLGFDTESRPVFRKGQSQPPPSLLQLAGEQEAYVFQLANLPLGDLLLELLENPAIIKSGVSVRDDLLALQRLTEFEPGGFVDLGNISSKFGMQTHGLRNLTANLLGFRISKAAQCSNWSRSRLSPQQVNYAATDAWIGRELYLAFQRLGMV